MQYDNIEKEIEMLDMWVKKGISEKAFVFATSKKVKRRNFAIARKHYGRIVILSDWFSLPNLEMYLYGICQVKWLKQRCRMLPYGRNYQSGYQDLGITSGRIVNGILTPSL